MAPAHPVSRPVAHHIHFWEHISPGKDGLSRAHSAPVAIRRMQQAPGRQDCHVHYQLCHVPVQLHLCCHKQYQTPRSRTSAVCCVTTGRAAQMTGVHVCSTAHARG